MQSYKEKERFYNENYCWLKLFSNSARYHTEILFSFESVEKKTRRNDISSTVNLNINFQYFLLSSAIIYFFCNVELNRFNGISDIYMPPTQKKLSTHWRNRLIIQTNLSSADPIINGLRMQRTGKIIQNICRKKLPNRQRSISKFAILAERIVLVFKVTAWRRRRAFQL